ncbi:hypothetical protein G9A89_004500 [Geosiphon pyriformis]|nr:hypothetical protein G9A89_004500 [Geosiphon pyriformis]
MKIESEGKTTSFTQHISPRFPPVITPFDLIKRAMSKLKTSRQPSRIPNAFIAYRIAFFKELRSMKHSVITQPQLSTMAKESWSREPINIRNEYKQIAADARQLYKNLRRENLPKLHDEQKPNLKNEPTQVNPIINTEKEQIFNDIPGNNQCIVPTAISIPVYELEKNKDVEDLTFSPLISPSCSMDIPFLKCHLPNYSHTFFLSPPIDDYLSFNFINDNSFVENQQALAAENLCWFLTSPNDLKNMDSFEKTTISCNVYPS